MVFSSIPVYLDPPNWHQQPNHPLGSGTTENHSQLPPLPPPQFGNHVAGGATDGSGGSGTASIRPNSMADRARLAKIPQPETALKCPRCESTNTKFCYFNNYSLSQPRHFCKTCRRYWTRGGALRNVPVGGGCRRNKKSKSSSSSSRSKSPVSASSTENHQMRQTGSNPTGLINHLSQPQTQSLPFLESLQNLSRYGGAGNMGLNSFNEIQQAQAQSTDHMGFQIGAGNNLMNLSGGLGMDQWRNLQQIPFLGNTGFESSSSTGLYPFQSTTEGVDQDSQLRTTNSRVTTQVPPVKVEDHNHGVNLTRPFLGISGNNSNNNNNNNNQFWGGNTWTDLSGTLNSSSTSHLL